MKLTAELRTKPGTNAARGLRKQSKVPAVLYGSGESKAIVLELAQVDTLIASHERLVDLEMDGKVQQSLVQAVQFDTFGSEVLHMDFKRIASDDVITLAIALRFTGTPIGLLSGGLTDYHLVDLQISCKACDLPSEIVVPIEHMEVGSVLHVNELALPPGVTALVHPKAAVVQVVMSKKLKLDEDAETEADAEAAPDAGETPDAGSES